jgi:coatomer protein complex subunit epsilon
MAYTDGHRVAIIIQIELDRNRLDLAKKNATAARKWAQDSLLVNIAESWIGMREVGWLTGRCWTSLISEQGGEKYQAAYYVFEELAQAEATQSVQSLVGQAVSELHLGRLPESEAAFDQAQGVDPDSPDLLANLIVLNTILGKDTTEQRKALQKVQPEHKLLVDLAEKKIEFEKASERYTPRVKA